MVLLLFYFNFSIHSFLSFLSNISDYVFLMHTSGENGDILECFLNKYVIEIMRPCILHIYLIQCESASMQQWVVSFMACLHLKVFVVNVKELEDGFMMT